MSFDAVELFSSPANDFEMTSRPRPHTNPSSFAGRHHHGRGELHLVGPTRLGTPSSARRRPKSRNDEAGHRSPGHGLRTPLHRLPDQDARFEGAAKSSSSASLFVLLKLCRKIISFNAEL